MIISDYLKSYTGEYESGTRPVSGVSTSVPGFLGLAEKGSSRGIPQPVSSTAEFRKKYGGYLPGSAGNYRFLRYAVEQFFLNGGKLCYVMRVRVAGSAAASRVVSFTHSFNDPEIASGENLSDDCIKFTATSEGCWGNRIKVAFAAGGTTKVPIGEQPENAELSSCKVNGASNFRSGDIVAVVPSDITENWLDNPCVRYASVSGVDGSTVFFNKPVRLSVKADYFMYLCDIHIKISSDYTEEVYEQVTLNADSPDYICNRLSASELVLLESNSARISEICSDIQSHPFRLMFPYSEGAAQEFTLTGGEDGNMSADMSESFIGTGGSEKTGLAAFTDNDKIAILAAPGITDTKIQTAIVAHCDAMQNRFAILDMPCDASTVDELTAHRETLDSVNAAMYHPWLEGYDNLENRNIYMPPSGAVAGVYARVDQARGVHKAPANEPLNGISGLSLVYGRAEQTILNPTGVNLILPFTGQGIRIWGARTCSSISPWKYINVRRLLIYIQESIKTSTAWVVSEPNDRVLWLKVRQMICEFLEGLRRDGALFGTSSDEAFFVEIGESTMTPDDIYNGRLICNIGLALVKPAEFVTFKLIQLIQKQ